MTTTLYGIRACDTMKKARTWLDGQGVSYTFHDYKTAGVDRATLERWVDRLGWEALLNRSGTTFRKLPEEQRADVDRDGAIAIMLANPSSIRRPVLEDGDTLLVGFKPDIYAQHWA
ncbi:ArsC family reductase [Sphingomonas sp. PL-96]|uniref:ArsC family reductase n=1 Tax=Sphingomonas sp. PL-96 TaxID=2887201 RepID=UPI001E315F80|nr:ArsC family reductase [Sphingomonas sp. PL-96]MCC2975380.1 ArsC family reductase [Sphingomonas sp. PL-96]